MVRDRHGRVNITLLWTSIRRSIKRQEKGLRGKPTHY